MKIFNEISVFIDNFLINWLIVYGVVNALSCFGFAFGFQIAVGTLIFIILKGKKRRKYETYER